MGITGGTSLDCNTPRPAAPARQRRSTTTRTIEIAEAAPSGPRSRRRPGGALSHRHHAHRPGRRIRSIYASTSGGSSQRSRRKARASSTSLIGTPRGRRRGRTRGRNRPGSPGVGVDQTSAPSCPQGSGSGGRMTIRPFGPCFLAGPWARSGFWEPVRLGALRPALEGVVEVGVLADTHPDDDITRAGLGNIGAGAGRA